MSTENQCYGSGMALLALDHYCFEVAFVVAFITKEFQSIFNVPHCSQLLAFADMRETPEEWNEFMILAFRLHKYLGFVHSKLKHHEGPFIYSTNIVFVGRQRCDIIHLLGAWANVRKRQGLELSLVAHADFGGLTSAVHLLSSKKVDASVFKAPPALPRVLAHIIDTACPDSGQEISQPNPLVGHIDLRPISEEGVLRQEGMLNVFGAPNLKIACPCVFKFLGWTQPPLLAKEFLRAFDSPLNMDVMLLDSCCERHIHSCFIGLSQLLLQWQFFALCG